MEGSTIGDRYRLERVLGSGGMATVWLAEDERLGRQVAVKVLSDALAADADYRRRFEREARIAAGLSHPHLVEVFDFGSADERPYLVMEYVAGPTMADRIAAGDLPETSLPDLAAALLSALDRIHAAGVVHRDVKPANILLGPEGRARLTDFGIARGADTTALTQTGNVMGTLKYMAPEVREGRPATERSDLYSCGVVLRECAGSRSGGASFDALVRRLTEPDPEKRPPSASAALALLEAGAGEASAEATAPTAPISDAREELPPEGKRPRVIRLGPAAILAVLAALALVGLVLVLALGGGNSSPTRSRSPGTASQATQKSPTTTVVSTTTQTTSSPAPAPAAAPTAEATSTTAAPSCAQLEAQRKALDERQHLVDEHFKENPEAKKQAHDAIEARKHALDEQLHACK